MTAPDVRWLQRLENYGRALATLQRAVALANERVLSELEEQGLIQAFEFTHELSWGFGHPCVSSSLYFTPSTPQARLAVNTSIREGHVQHDHKPWVNGEPGPHPRALLARTIPASGVDPSPVKAFRGMGWASYDDAI